jgi:hypothetical protein
MKKYVKIRVYIKNISIFEKKLKIWQNLDLVL